MTDIVLKYESPVTVHVTAKSKKAQDLIDNILFQEFNRAQRRFLTVKRGGVTTFEKDAKKIVKAAKLEKIHITEKRAVTLYRVVSNKKRVLRESFTTEHDAQAAIVKLIRKVKLETAINFYDVLKVKPVIIFK